MVIQIVCYALAAAAMVGGLTMAAYHRGRSSAFRESAERLRRFVEARDD